MHCDLSDYFFDLVDHDLGNSDSGGEKENKVRDWSMKRI